MSHISQLPLETLLIILLYIQPDYVPSNSRQFAATAGNQETWLESNGRPGLFPQHIYKEKKERRHFGVSSGSVLVSPTRSKFHPSINISPGTYLGLKRPSLLTFGSVSCQFRRTCLLHPFWVYLRWHHLLPIPATRTIGGYQDIPSKFIKLMKKESGRLQRVRHAFLDFGKWGWDMDANSVGALLNGLQVDRLKTLIIDAGWATTSNASLLHFISIKFKSIENLSITGHPSTNVLFGLSSKSIDQITSISKSMTLGSFLVRLSLTSYGANSFTLTSLLAMLKASRNSLKELSLTGGPIPEGGLDLSRIGDIIGPNLESLSLAFSFVGPTYSDDPNLEYPPHHLAAIAHMMGWEPIVHGSLKNFTALRHFSMSDDGLWNISRAIETFPLRIIRRMFDSMPNDQLLPLNISLHMQSVPLVDLHKVPLPSSVASRLTGLHLFGDSKKTNISGIIRCLGSVLGHCPELRVFGANYKDEDVARIMEAVSFENRRIQFLTL